MASLSGDSSWDEEDEQESALRRLGQLQCVNRCCESGASLENAMGFVCAYYCVEWKANKQVCQQCFAKCLFHYGKLEERFKNKKCVMDYNFPSYDNHMLIETSSSSEEDDDDPMPSTSRYGLPPDQQVQSAINIGIDYIMQKNHVLVDTQLDLCKKYLKTKYTECMREADKIDNIVRKLETGLQRLRNTVYGPYKPILTILPSDSEQQSEDEVIDVEEDINVNEIEYVNNGVVISEIIDVESDLDVKEVIDHEKVDAVQKKEDDKSVKNKEHKIDKKEGETNKDKQNKVVIAKANKEEDETDIIAINRTVCTIPSNLPKEGTVEYPPLSVGEKIVGSSGNLLRPWFKCTVRNLVNEDYICIKISGSMDRIVQTQFIAYYSQSSVRFPVGIRVIAMLKNHAKYIDAFYAGTIAEPPKLLNKFRYMIFFDNGHVQYQYHKHIRLIVHQNFDQLWRDVHPNSRDFIRNYLEKYPERQMVRLTNDHTVRAEFENEWHSAKVLEVDASLVKLYFIEKDCIEWLYRGSSRLWNIYEKQSNLERGIRLRQSGLAYLKKPFIEYSSVEEEPSRPAKMVARKSTSKISTAPHSEETKKAIQNKYNNFKLNYLVVPNNSHEPIDFVQHKCSSQCIERFDYSYLKTKLINMLAIPLYFGFSRCLSIFNTYQKCMIYITPCGRGIRNMKEMHDYLLETNSKMTIDQFDFNSWVRPLVEFQVKKSKIFSSDMSEGKEFRGISLVNTLNYNAPPKMDYMTVRQAMPGVNINVENEFLCGCDCTDNCQDKSKCACWQLTIEGQKILPNLDRDPNIGYSYRRLPERVLTGIYECNKTCKCSKSCLNRVVQNPLSQKLQLFLTEKKGWGVRCLNDIPQGTFICIYVGYLLTETDANEGGKNYGDEYLAELDYIEVVEKIKEDYETDVPLSDNDDNLKDASNTNSESSDDDSTTVGGTNITRRLRKRDKSKNTTKTKKDGSHVCVSSKLNTCEMKNNPKLPKSMREYFGNNESVYIMDAKTSGNIGRYLNHSCSPNVFVQNVFVDTHDLRFPWVSFFSLHYIQAGTELTWDYSYDIGSVPGKTMKCHCESVYCRGRLL